MDEHDLPTPLVILAVEDAVVGAAREIQEEFTEWRISKEDLVTMSEMLQEVSDRENQELLDADEFLIQELHVREATTTGGKVFKSLNTKSLEITMTISMRVDAPRMEILN